MTHGLLGIIKFAVFIVLLPIVIGVISGFQEELLRISGGGEIFWWGVIAYTIFHLFIFTPQGLYRFWQSVFMEICSFIGVAANALVLAVPIITTVLLLVYFLVTVIFNQTWGQESLIFFTGISMALHVILSAQELYEEDDSRIKGHYLFNISAVFIVNVILLVLLFDLIFKKFSFLGFFDSAFQSADYIYGKILTAAGIRW